MFVTDNPLSLACMIANIRRRSFDNLDYYVTGIGTWADEPPAGRAGESIQDDLDNNKEEQRSGETKEEKVDGMEQGKSKNKKKSKSKSKESSHRG